MRFRIANLVNGRPKPGIFWYGVGEVSSSIFTVHSIRPAGPQCWPHCSATTWLRRDGAWHELAVPRSGALELPCVAHWLSRYQSWRGGHDVARVCSFRPKFALARESTNPNACEIGIPAYGVATDPALKPRSRQVAASLRHPAPVSG